jgi:hypothetical protein
MNPVMRVTALMAPVICVIWLPAGARSWPVARRRKARCLLGMTAYARLIQQGMDHSEPVPGVFDQVEADCCDEQVQVPPHAGTPSAGRSTPP